MNQLGGNMAGHLMEDARFSEPLPASTQVLYPGVNGGDQIPNVILKAGAEAAGGDYHSTAGKEIPPWHPTP